MPARFDCGEALCYSMVMAHWFTQHEHGGFPMEDVVALVDPRSAKINGDTLVG
jgi:hypothetical protein